MVLLDPTNVLVAAFLAAVGWSAGRIAADLLRRLGLVIYNSLVRWAFRETGESP